MILVLLILRLGSFGRAITALVALDAPVTGRGLMDLWIAPTV